jgi:hypothetical protein
MIEAQASVKVQEDKTFFTLEMYNSDFLYCTMLKGMLNWEKDENLWHPKDIEGKLKRLKAIQTLWDFWGWDKNGPCTYGIDNKIQLQKEIKKQIKRYQKDLREIQKES